MPLDFGKHDDVVYKHAPLVAVLCQVRFSPILSLLTEAGLTGLQTLLRDRYPKFEKDVETNVGLSNDGLKLERKAPLFTLTSEDGVWRVSIAVDFVALETPNYTNFGEFLLRMTEILDAVHRTLRPTSSVRVGLRKVNHLHSEAVTSPHEWSEIVNPVLLGALGCEEFPVAPVFALSDLRFQDGDNMLVVRHGLHPENPAIYILDQDYSTERPYDIDAPAEITNLLQHFSDGMTSFFSWGLTDKYKQTLGPEPRAETGARP